MANFNCDDLAALLPVDRCYDAQQQQQLWNVVKDIICAVCTISVPSGTDPSGFACYWESLAGGWPDSSNCPVLTVIEGCNIWMAPNDPLNCDLGDCPAVPGTGGDWVLIGSDQVGNIKAVFHAVNIVQGVGYINYGNSGIPLQYQDVLLEDAVAGTYDNSPGISRWTCNKSGFYRFSFTYSIQVNTVGWYNAGAAAVATHQAVLTASFASNAVIKISQMIISTGVAFPGITTNFYLPYQYWGFAPGLPAGVNASAANIDPFNIAHVYLEAGQSISFSGNSSLQTSGGTIQWRFSQNAYPPYSDYLVIEEVQL